MDKISDEQDRAQALRNRAAALAQDRHYAEAETLARSIRADWWRVSALSALALALAQVGDPRADAVFEEGNKLAANIQSEKDQPLALRALTTALAQAGQYETAHLTAQSIHESAGQAEALCALAGALGKAKDARVEGIVAEVYNLAGSVPADDDRTYILDALMTALAQIGRFEEAETVARSISEE